MVWPILEYDTSNAPFVCFTLANKGVGPAIIRRAQVKVDGQTVPDWQAALQKLLGPGEHNSSINTMVGHVLSPGETMNVLVPLGADDKPLSMASHDPLYERMGKARFRVSIEVCFSSTLGECWTLREGRNASSVIVETSSCPAPSANDFQHSWSLWSNLLSSGRRMAVRLLSSAHSTSPAPVAELGGVRPPRTLMDKNTATSFLLFFFVVSSLATVPVAMFLYRYRTARGKRISYGTMFGAVCCVPLLIAWQLLVQNRTSGGRMKTGIRPNTSGAC